MLKMSQVNSIRDLSKSGYRVADIAKKLGIDRKTVRKYLGKDDFSPRPPVTANKPSVLDPYKPLINKWLKEDQRHWHKQQHTAKRVFDELQEKIAVLEEHLLSERTMDRVDLADIRRQLIVSRRYLAPQRDLFSRLANEKIGWLEADDLRRLQEIADRLGRWLEDLDSSIARTSLLADEMNALLTEAMTRRTYIMSIMAMVFLPATFLTGLFGVNLGGIPGGQSETGFLMFVSTLVTLIVCLALWLRLHKWL